ncbi:hypothetical protein EYF80_024847 [Liparis tanakae]|uniref:Uncharacterized protein n=1 Tax=Liparis tanakae TaxID=230148 RepID=A0A4Z2HJ49_9TELE|nr:hypothetical protein EYF80_024847 [Liparis tanakae]
MACKVPARAYVIASEGRDRRLNGSSANVKCELRGERESSAVASAAPSGRGGPQWRSVLRGHRADAPADDPGRHADVRQV